MSASYPRSTATDVRAFTTHYPTIVRALKTPCKVGPAFKPEGIPPKDQLNDFTALWDTGATRSAITAAVAEALCLTSVGKATVRGIHGMGVMPTYVISLWLPHQVCFSELAVLEGGFGGCDLLIGMDVIRRGDFAISNFHGRTNLTFRMPSRASLDFVTEIRDSQRATPRNAPCPCGSGKKYKNCCAP